jgi:hypothetical protein
MTCLSIFLLGLRDSIVGYTSVQQPAKYIPTEFELVALNQASPAVSQHKKRHLGFFNGPQNSTPGPSRGDQMRF